MHKLVLFSLLPSLRSLTCDLYVDTHSEMEIILPCWTRDQIYRAVSQVYHTGNFTLLAQILGQGQESGIVEQTSLENKKPGIENKTALNNEKSEYEAKSQETLLTEVDNSIITIDNNDSEDICIIENITRNEVSKDAKKKKILQENEIEMDGSPNTSSPEKMSHLGVSDKIENDTILNDHPKEDDEFSSNHSDHKVDKSGHQNEIEIERSFVKLAPDKVLNLSITDTIEKEILKVRQDIFNHATDNQRLKNTSTESFVDLYDEVDIKIKEYSPDDYISQYMKQKESTSTYIDHREDSTLNA